jgi:DNA polymerase-3 subunit beta
VTGVAARSGGGSDYELSTLDIEEFPPTTRVKEGVEFQLPEQDLHAALSATAFAMSTEAARLVLCGTYVSLNGTLQLVATDGRRLALDLAGETDAKEPAEVILPARAVHELLKLLDAGSDRKVTGVIGKNAAQFHLADTTLNCKVIEGTYPNYRQVMPSEDSARVKCPIGRADLLAALRRVALVSPEQCELEIAGQMLTVRGLGKDVGRACETLLVPKCEPVTLKFKPAYLIEGLAAVAAEEVVFVASADEATPAMFRLKDSTAWTYVVCPMRDPAPAPAPAAPVPETETKSETKSKK